MTTQSFSDAEFERHCAEIAHNLNCPARNLDRKLVIRSAIEVGVVVLALLAAFIVGYVVGGKAL